MVIMPTLIKGVVQEKRESLMQIHLITGKRFWTFLRDDLDIREQVWVGWDYTTGSPARVLSETELKQLKEEVTKHEVFSNPEDEGTEDEDEVRSFSDPMDEENEERWDRPNTKDFIQY